MEERNIKKSLLVLLAVIILCAMCSCGTSKKREVHSTAPVMHMTDMIVPSQIDNECELIWIPEKGYPYQYDRRWINYCAYNLVDRINPAESDIDYYLDCWVGSSIEEQTLRRN